MARVHEAPGILMSERSVEMCLPVARMIIAKSYIFIVPFQLV